jgi:hypothetical protein
MDRLLADIQCGPVSLHQVFSANVFLAHAVDYVRAIRNADGSNETRTDLVRGFDETFSVEGARIGNRKFELIDAINNSLKHISLDADRYDHLVKKYGQISFRSLVQEDGRVLCILEGYRFDYVRVVLRPAYMALAGLGHASAESILDFARGEAVIEHWVPGDLMSSSDPADAIDQMIEYCNPACEDCGEQELECKCAQFVYDGAEGKFVSTFHAHFDFDTVMSRISGAYRAEKP